MQTYLPTRKSRELYYSLTLLLVVAQAAFAGGVVTNNTDVALRGALAGGGLVQFAMDGTIVLTNGLPISVPTVIDATGLAVTISGGNAFRVFEVGHGGALTLSNITVANGWGLTAGGFVNLGNLTLINCTISNNTAYSFGMVAGGVLNLGTLFASGCTFVGNVSSTNASFSADASAITSTYLLSSSAEMSLVNCTFFGNSIPASPSGNVIFQSGNKASLIVNCTIAGTVRYFGGPPNQQGSITLRNTIAYAAAGDTNSSFNLITPNPGLGPLDDYGGPTLTMPLLAGSPAIDGGDPTNHPLTDQRGRSRPYGLASDIGAFESSSPFIIRGQVSGFTLASEVSIAAGVTTTITTNHGTYSLESLAAGDHTVTPTSADYLFVPNSRLVTVGPDQLDVNFKAYRWNALSLDGISGNLMYLAYAGTNGNRVQLLTSSNWFNWLAVATNTIGSSNLLEFQLPFSLETPRQFYRTAQE